MFRTILFHPRKMRCEYLIFDHLQFLKTQKLANLINMENESEKDRLISTLAAIGLISCNKKFVAAGVYIKTDSGQKYILSNIICQKHANCAISFDDELLKFYPLTIYLTSETGSIFKFSGNKPKIKPKELTCQPQTNVACVFFLTSLNLNKPYKCISSKVEDMDQMWSIKFDSVSGNIYSPLLTTNVNNKSQPKCNF